VATNLGWFPGIVIGLQAADLVLDASPLLRACIAGLCASVLFGAGQAFVLRGLLAWPGVWWGGTVVGWTVGVAGARVVLDSASLGLGPVLDSVAVGFIAGGVVGIPQAWILSAHSGRWAWWPLISSVGWGVLFPGAVPGLGLVWLTRSPRLGRC
jgi:hypothetical protein